MDRVSNPSHDSSLTEVFGGNVREEKSDFLHSKKNIPKIRKCFLATRS